MPVTDVNKLRSILDRWKEADSPDNNVDLNKLAEETLSTIESEPFIKDICQAFLCSISIKAIKDPNFDKPIDKGSSNIKIKNITVKDVRKQKK